MGHDWGRIGQFVRVYIACGCAWTFWSCLCCQKNKVAPLCQMVPMITTNQQCHFHLLYSPIHNFHGTCLRNTGTRSERIQGPNDDQCHLGPQVCFVLSIIDSFFCTKLFDLFFSNLPCVTNIPPPYCMLLLWASAHRVATGPFLDNDNDHS